MAVAEEVLRGRLGGETLAGLTRRGADLGDAEVLTTARAALGTLADR